MPTSATGSPDRESPGFTIVELMVVLAIVGLMTAVVAVNLPASRDDLVREGGRMAARLVAARDHAIVANRETAAIVDAAGYRFVERRGAAWQPIDDVPLVDTKWREGTNFAGEARVSFDSVGLAEPAALVLRSNEHTITVRVAASGEVRVDAAR